MLKYFCQDSFMFENKSFSLNICFSSNRSAYFRILSASSNINACTFIKARGKFTLRTTLYTQQTYNICKTFVQFVDQRRNTLYIVQMLYKCFVFAGYKPKVNDGE